MIPQVFNGIEVWRLCWPQEDIKIMVFKPSLGLLAGVLGVIVLLEDDITCRFPIIAKAGLKVLLQNLDVKVPIHPPINLAGIARSIPQHAAPDHHRSPPQTSEYPAPAYHSSPPQPFSTAISSHLTPAC